MKLKPLTTLPNPVLNSAEEGQKYSRNRTAFEAVNGAFQRWGADLAQLDGSELDRNPRRGEVVVVDHYLSSDDGNPGMLQSAGIEFDPDSGQVHSFKLLKDESTAYVYEHKNRPDFGVRDSSATVIWIKDGKVTEFETGLYGQ